MPISFLYLPDLEGLRVAVGLTSCAASVPPHRRSPRLSSTAATRSPSKPISLTSRSACAPDGTDQVGRRSASARRNVCYRSTAREAAQPNRPDRVLDLQEDPLNSRGMGSLDVVRRDGFGRPLRPAQRRPVTLLGIGGRLGRPKPSPKQAFSLGTRPSES
jgi:hypothetical protein